MSNPNVNLPNLDARYITPTQVDAKITAQSGQYLPAADGRVPAVMSGTTSAAYAITDQLNQYGLVIFNDGSLGYSQLESSTAQRTANQLAPLITTMVPSQFKSSYNATTISIASGPDIIAMGDSLTAGAGGGGTTYSSVLAAATGRTVRNSGVGGETSIGINARQGGQPYLLLPSGNQIPASGGVTVALSLPSGLSSWPLLQGTGTGGTMHGTLAGVPGVLTLTQPSNPGYTHNATDYYTFTRDAAGSVISVSRPTAFYVDFNEGRRGDIYCYWYGRNNLTATAQVVGDISSSILHQQALDKRFLVLSVLNGTNEASGSANYNSIITLNTQLMQSYGRRYVDVRSYLVNYGLADAGITPTAQDTTDISGDCIPTSLHATSDTIHLNAAGYTVVGNLVATRLAELGWL